MESLTGKKAYTEGLSWAAARWRYLPPTPQILKVSKEALPGFSYIYHPDGLSTTSLAQGCILGTASGNRKCKLDALSKDRDCWSPPLGPSRVMSSPHPLSALHPSWSAFITLYAPLFCNVPWLFRKGCHSDGGGQLGGCLLAPEADVTEIMQIHAGEKPD